MSLNLKLSFIQVVTVNLKLIRVITYSVWPFDDPAMGWPLVSIKMRRCRVVECSKIRKSWKTQWVEQSHILSGILHAVVRN